MGLKLKNFRMKKVFIESARKVLQNRENLEKELGVRIFVKGREVSIEGDEVKVHFASQVLEALDYPFSVEQALLLRNEEFMFEVLNIKDFTHRKDLDVIKGRIIGKKGRTLEVLQELSDCFIVVKGHDVAIIGRADNFERARQAVISLIQGSKQGNVYSYLEKIGKGEFSGL